MENLDFMRTRLHLIILMTFVSLFASAHSVEEQDGFYEVEHSWMCNGKECSIVLNISTDLYDYYCFEREHLAYIYQFNEDEMQPNYFGFMLSEHDRPIIRALADEFTGNVASEKERIELALSFVQSLPYAYDSTTKGVDEYLRYPIETLVDGCGDCEDKVALLSALLYEMDVDFILLVMPEHMAIGVCCDGVDASRGMLFRGKRYYYLETTMPNWQIGEIPKDFHHPKVKAVPVDTTPSLLLKGVRFESQPTAFYNEADCDLELDLHNLGPGKVTEIMAHIRVVVKGVPNILLAEQWYSLDDMAEGEARTEKLSLKSLIKERSVLEVELMSAETERQPYSVGINYSKVGN